jgi:redox-sensitive bicupin YhaK (pirin superfamily)
MLWHEDIPRIDLKDGSGKTTEVTVIAGSVEGSKAPPPNPDSWAAPEENEVAIWLIKMEAGAEWQIPAESAEVTRSLYYYQGERIRVDGQEVSSYKSANLHRDQKITIQNGGEESRILLLQGRPIEEPVIQYGPFVMNTEAEIRQAFMDYQKTEFGGWPWPRPDQVHERSKGRFARYADGTEEAK